MGGQCCTKVKKLCQEYKKVKDKQNLTGHRITEWKFFSKVDEILCAQPAPHPPVLLETLDPQLILSDHDSDEADVEEVQEGSVQDYSSVADNQNGSGNKPEWQWQQYC